MRSRLPRPPRRRILRPAALLLCLALGAAPAAGGDDAPPPPPADGPVFRASASFDELERLGQEEIRFELSVHNPLDRPVEIRGANLFICHEGGWLMPLDPESLDGRLFGDPLHLAPGEDRALGARTYRAFTPAMRILLDADLGERHARFSVPIVRAGFAEPAPCAIAAPLGVGVVGPLEAVPFSDGTVAVLLEGQHQVLGGGLPEQVRTTVSVGSDKGSTEPESWEGLDTHGDRRALWPFTRRVQVFSGFDGGRLRLESHAVLAGEETQFSRTWPVERVEPAALRAPVLGTWQMSNGPGQTALHGRDLWPQHRYAYDMVVLKQGRTHDGDPHDNGSYYAWNRSIRAAADGEVVAVCALERDNPGYRGALTTCYDNHVVIRHADGLHTAYLHIRKDSVAQGLKVGAKVSAGQVIARVGNSGDSSEPHLHFLAFRIDATGRWRSVPVHFANASHDAKGTQPVEGVALGGRIYHFRDR